MEEIRDHFQRKIIAKVPFQVLKSIAIKSGNSDCYKNYMNGETAEHFFPLVIYIDLLLANNA